MREFLDELKRRNVLRVAVGYLAAAWLVIQVLETVFPIFGLPDVYLRRVIIGLTILFVPVLVLSWTFEWSPSGIERQRDVDRGGARAGRGPRTFDRHGEALELFEEESDESYSLKGRALAHFALGQQEASDAALAALIEKFGDQWPSEIAHVYAYRGELDQAFAWLDREFEKYGPGGWGEWQLQRLYDNLRGDPRWLAFLERTGTAPRQLAGLKLDLPQSIY